MKSTLTVLALAALSVFWGPQSSAFGQDAKVALGTVSVISARSLTVKVGDQTMTFSVDPKTLVRAPGGSTKSARASAAGKSGPHLGELLEAGQSVSVTYRDTAGALHATAISTIAKAPAVATVANADMHSAGVVTSLGADWITISGRTGPASFEQTFKIDPATKVFAKGAGTATAAKGGRLPFPDIVRSGDRVTISYHMMGDSLLASDVHVTIKKAGH